MFKVPYTISFEDRTRFVLMVSVPPWFTVILAAAGSTLSVTLCPDMILTCSVAVGTPAHPQVPATFQLPLATPDRQALGVTLAHQVPHLLSLPPTIGATRNFAYSWIVQKEASSRGSTIV